jgi:anti-sigma factor RsiW
MTVHSSKCPVDLDEVAEGYVLGLLPTEQAIAFEDHYATCEACATVVYKTVDYVDSMRAAAKTLRSQPRSYLKMVGGTGNS